MLQNGIRGKRFFIICAAYFLIAHEALTAQPLTAVQNYAINRPGVVMVKTVFSANVYVNRMRMDNRRFNRLLDYIQRLDSNRGISPEQKLDIVLKELSNNPDHFFKTTLDYFKHAEEITSTGTGFLFTNDGYLATNCHLIDRENSFIRRQFILSAFKQVTNENIAALESSWATTFTEQQRSLLYNTCALLYLRLFSMVLYDLKNEIYVVYRKDSGQKESLPIKKIATVVIKGQLMPGKDIAILKIDGDSTLPTLRISGTDLPRVGEQLFVYGYPGPVTNNDFVSSESAIEPTLTTGIVSAIKKSVTGWPVIQMDANINHGSSGGPVCNGKGEVIGMTTFGSLENGGGLAAGLNFALPVSILRDYLDTTNITPQTAKSTAIFSEGIILFGKEYYHKAAKKFKEVKKMDPHYLGLDYYLKESDENIKSGLDKESSGFFYDLLGFGLILLVILLMMGFLTKIRPENNPHR